MTLSARELELLAPELDDLVGGTLREVRCPSATAVWLEARVPGRNLRLLIETAPNLARVHLVPGKAGQRERPTGFVMLLRKHIVGARVLATSRAPGDRNWRLHLGHHDERFCLAFTWRRAGGNVFLLDDAQAVVGSLHPATGPGPLEPVEVPDAVRAALNLDSLGLSALPVGTRSDAVDAHYEAMGTDADADQDAAARQRTLRRALKAARRKLGRIEQDVARVEESPRWRRLGELLQSAYGRVERGAHSVRVQDFYDPELRHIDIPVDPKRDLAGNIEAYFRRYRKFSEAQDKVLERLELAQAQVHALEAAAADDSVDLDTLHAAGHLPRAAVVKQRETSAARQPYYTFTSRSGLTILVGRGGKDNDTLSLKVARGNDVWMHAKDWAGAHVVIRVPRGTDPDHDALLDGALLAVHYSKGRKDSVTDVLYTHAKHIRKPKGAPPGRVTVAGGKGIAVRPDPDRLARLMAGRS